jgi:hypothetical protein
MEEERNNLVNLEKEQLVEIILKLKVDLSKQHDDFMKLTNLRLYNLERSQYMYEQYGRRECLEITGIPETITDTMLEDEVIEIMKEARVEVDDRPLNKMDITAVHRLADKKTTIVRVVNRKFVKKALINGKNLKNCKRYGHGDNSKIYLNDSFCPEFRFLNFVIRKALRENNIYKYKIRNGVTSVQKDEYSLFVQIGHVNDLENLKIPIPERRTR